MDDSRPRSAFAQWMLDCHFDTDAQAAEVLGIAPVTAMYLRRGVGPDGKTYLPSKPLRRLMFAIAGGCRLKEWVV